MSKRRAHPKREKYCVFCKYWIGNADLNFISTTTGYSFESFVRGNCAKRNTTMSSDRSACNYYVPNIDAEKLL
ncbi:MAG: hypothetical protein IJZ72_00550 [Oscillospiraceae bacterium]|nr:hypothetical protein [Oscillospiraceae bacterium]